MVALYRRFEVSVHEEGNFDAICISYDFPTDRRTTCNYSLAWHRSDHPTIDAKGVERYFRSILLDVSREVEKGPNYSPLMWEFFLTYVAEETVCRFDHKLANITHNSRITRGGRLIGDRT